MRKVELLSPVGNKEMFYQAIHNGADAVYLAGTHYGARKFADNFQDDELIEIFSYARLYGVKVYVTVNTLIYENEVRDLLKYVEFLYRNGVDAIIMQDIGMMKLIHERFPNLEIHASTQCHNHDEDTVAFWKNFGVTRVVLARELSLDEIKSIDIDIEKEVFVYGALCVCYSGCCLFSSMNGGRSGNRGECVGSCRLPYQLIQNRDNVFFKEKYLLSTKELNTLDYVKELIESGITSFKVEGRMKSPYYVGYVTRMYRKLIDQYNQGKIAKLSMQEKENLKKLFNREFTMGYLFQDKDIMNINSPNHLGVPIGKVIQVNPKKIYIQLISDNLYQEDGIRFQNSKQGMIVNRLYNQKNLLVNHIDACQIAVIDNKFNHQIIKQDIVLKTIDRKLIRELENYSLKKINISFKGEFLIGESFWIEITDGIHKIKGMGEIVESARKREVTEEDIIKCLNKVGNTPFSCNDICIHKDSGIFVNLKSINEVRRKITEELIETRKKNTKEVIINDSVKKKNEFMNDNSQCYFNVLVRTEEQLKCCLKYKINSIYVVDYDLYCKYKHLKNIYYRTDRVIKEEKKFQNDKLLVGDLGSIYRYQKENQLVGDYYLNVTNSYSVNTLRQFGLQRVTLSVELDKEKIRDIMKFPYFVELIIYGRVELMITKYCPLKKCFNYCSKCMNSQEKFYLQDKVGNKYPILRKSCITHIMNCQNIDKLKELEEYQKMGIHYYRLELFDEKREDLENIMEKINLKKSYN